MNHQFTVAHGPVRLRPLDAEGSELYRMLRSRAESRVWFGDGAPITRSRQAKWFARYLGDPTEVMFSVFDEFGLYLGGNGLYHIDRTKGEAEYGRLVIDRSRSGRGYGLHATLAAAEVAREQLGLSRVNLEVYSENAPAIRTYLRAGFSECGYRDDGGREVTLMRLDL